MSLNNRDVSSGFQDEFILGIEKQTQSLCVFIIQASLFTNLQQRVAALTLAGVHIYIHNSGTTQVCAMMQVGDARLCTIPTVSVVRVLAVPLVRLYASLLLLFYCFYILLLLCL